MSADLAGTGVLYLGGIGRSGSTLLERLVAEVPGVTGLGEVMHMWDRGVGRNELCGCGTPFRECPFWTEVGQRAFGGWDHVDVAHMAHLKDRVDRVRRMPRHHSRLGAGLRAEVLEYAARFRAVYEAAHAVTGDVVVDSSKQPSLASCVAAGGGVDIRVVHCVRDARGVAFSWTKKVARPEAVDPESAEMARYSPTRLARHWMLHNGAVESLRRRMPVEVVRYEDLVDDPAAVLRRVIDFAGVPQPETLPVSGRTAHLSPSHTSAGNPMRFTSGEIEVRPDMRWLTDLPASQRRLVTVMTSPMLARYGYLRR